MTKKSAGTGTRSATRKTAPASAAKKPRAPKPLVGSKKPAAKSKAAPAKTKAGSSPAKTAKPGKAAGPAKTAKAKSRAVKKAAAILEPALEFPVPVDDPIGDLSDGEGRCYMHGDEPESFAEMAAYRADTTEDALEGTLAIAPENTAPAVAAEPESETSPAPAAPHPEGPRAQEREPAKLDRLQKILSHAGVASRRQAEEMILAGRVMVNGQVVTQLGAKADPARDHIRVDGKRIPAAERHRTFMLNKPRGFVTTVSDPEGRPTVMQFFSRMRERLYPVGRLDYDSEGLLLVTNDGELADRLTRAASGVEKTYLVKVAGRPTEEELDRLRSGVPIERGRPGSGQAQTAPAGIRELRRGAKPGSARSGPPPRGPQARAENPWFEVVLIEGRNRELRKMFQSIGHFVEKIRRVGYGPLVLDIEPGQLRELTPEELAQLRRAAEGKGHPLAKPHGFDSPRDERSGRSFEPRNPQRSGRRTPGKPQRFSPRREERNRPGPSASAHSTPPRSFNSRERGENRFRKFDSGRGPRANPRFDPHFDRRPDNRERGDWQRDTKRGRNDNFPSNFDRNKERNADRGFARRPGPRFGAPRNAFDRRGSAAAPNDWPGRRPDRTGPKRNESDRSASRRGESGPFAPDRYGPHRGDQKHFGKTGYEPNRARRHGDPGAREENPPRPARYQSSPASPARGAKAGFHRGKATRNPPRPGRERS